MRIVLTRYLVGVNRPGFDGGSDDTEGSLS